MGRKDWRTPPAFFMSRWDLWHFNVDAAADDHNALVGRLCPRSEGLRHELTGDVSHHLCSFCGGAFGRYYTAVTNGLNPDHYVAGDRVWCNPPYENVIAWVKLAAETRLRGVFWELLLQPATDTRWFHRYVWDKRLKRPREGVDVDFLEGRIKFIDPDDPTKDSPPGPNMLVRFIPEDFEL